MHTASGLELIEDPKCAENHGMTANSEFGANEVIVDPQIKSNLVPGADDEKVLFEPADILRNEHVTRESRILLADGLMCGEE